MSNLLSAEKFLMLFDSLDNTIGSNYNIGKILDKIVVNSFEDSIKSATFAAVKLLVVINKIILFKLWLM